MSEPTIKPVGRLCLECGQTGDHFYSCSHHMAPDEETCRVDVYGPDDLVAVAREAITEWNASAMIPLEIERDANELVERITRVKR
jgi:hypothetical protein